MAFNWHKFPWTNLHELNLDWIIQTVKTLEDNLTNAVGKFTEIVNTAVGAERTERIAADADIQAEIVTGVYPAISKSITDTITGSGDLTIDKTGAVNISGNGVKIEDKRTGGLIQILKGFAIGCTGTFAEIVNTTASKTLMLAYNGILQMRDNNLNPVSIYGIDTVDKAQTTAEARQNISASCGYVDGEIGAVNDAITAETNARNTGDAALQSTIDSVIMPLITALQQKAIFNIIVPVDDAFVSGNVTLDSAVIFQLKEAVSANRFISVTLSDNGASNDTLYLIINNHQKQIANPSEYEIYFKDIKGEHIADIDTATGVLTYSEF